MNLYMPSKQNRQKEPRPLPHTEPFPHKTFVKIDSKPIYLWRTADVEGEVLDVLVEKNQNIQAA